MGKRDLDGEPETLDPLSSPPVEEGTEDREEVPETFFVLFETLRWSTCGSPCVPTEQRKEI